MTSQAHAVTVAECPLVRDFGRNWLWVLLRGVLAIAFGVLAFFFPLAAGLTLTLLWGAYALTEGVVALVTAFQVRQSGRPIWPMIMMGVLGIVAGVMTFLAPRMTMLALLLLVAAWAVAVGGLMIVTAIRLRDEIEGEWFLGLAGLISVLFGIAMCAFPVSGAVAVAWVVAGHAVVLGVLLVLFAFKVRGLGRGLRAAPPAA